jgi:cellulose synthase/poly-beta-1,6-N-acetylglucosamine synthase-like glycosyltransferase
MWLFLFWASLGLVLYTYAGYPAILYLIGRFRAHREAPVQGSQTPSVCLIISAFNEESVIRQKIENSLALERVGPMTIIVASDGSNDRTVAIAREYEDHGVCVLDSPLRRGKNATLNEVVRGITEDIIVFTDANSLLARNAIVRLLARFNDASVGCVVGELKYADDTTSVGEGESLYWRYESRIKLWESLLGSVLVANGSIFAVRRPLFRDCFPDLANDFQTPFDVANLGYGTVYEPGAVAVERSAELWEEEFDRKVRIVLQGLTGFARLRSRMHGVRLWQFVSHKLIRWCVGAELVVTLVATAVLARGSAWFAGFLALQLVCYAAAFGGWLMRRNEKMPRALQVPFYFTMVNCAALVAMGRFVNGGRQVVWEKAESTRRNPAGAHGFPTQRLEPVVAGSAEATVTPRAAEK